MLNDTIKENIEIHAKQESPNECCGLILNIGGFIYSVPCKNVSDKPEESFIINPEEVYKYNFNDIIGFYHSHKDNENFSIADIAFTEKLKKDCILYCVDTKNFKQYTPIGAQIPYIGRPFFIGTLDCFTLFKDYYQRELNINLPEIQHPERFNYKFWSTNECYDKYGYCTIIKDYLSSNNFIKVSDLKKGDVLEIRMPNIKFPTHIAIYLEDNKILHHIFEFSNIEVYNNAYKRMTTAIYRHISLN